MKLKYLIIILVVVLVGCSNGEIIGENNTNVSDETAKEVKVGSDLDLTEEEIQIKYSKGSDLVAEIVSKSLYPALNEEIQIKFNAENEGTNKVETEFDYTIEISKGDDLIYTYSNSSNQTLNSGEDVNVKILNHKFDSYGTYTVTFYLDLLNKAKELDESNNDDTVKIYVKEKVVSNDDDDEEEEYDEGSAGECEDSDGGIDYDKIGTCTDAGSFKNGRKDFCAGDDRIGEMYCNQYGECDIEIYECEGICREGKCI